MEKTSDKKIVFQKSKYENLEPVYMNTTYMACDIPGNIAIRVAGLQDVEKLTNLMGKTWTHIRAKNEILEIVNTRPLDRYIIVSTCGGLIIGYLYRYRVQELIHLMIHVEDHYQQKGIDMALITKGREFEILRRKNINEK